MRALIGLCVLGGLFLIATTLQTGRSRAMRREREQLHGLGDPASDWSLLVLGSISGAEPIPEAEPAPSSEVEAEPPWTATGGTPGDPSTPTRYAPDYRYQLQGGDTLSVICKRHYGTARVALVEAVAHYNDLSSPDAVRAGSSILLPDRALLGQ